MSRSPESDRIGPPASHARWAKLRRLLVEYLRLRYRLYSLFTVPFGDARKRPSHVGRLLWPGLIMAVLVVLATPAAVFLLGEPAARFLDVNNQPRTIPIAALLLAGGAFALGWAYLLNGAGEGPGAIWVSGGLLYTFLVVTVGLFTIGESYLHVIPLALPVVIGGLTQHGNRWGKALLAVLLASILVRLIPEQASVRWYVLWLPVAAVLLGVQAILWRRPPPPPLVRLGLTTAVLGLYFAAVASDLVRLGRVAENLNLVLTQTIGFLGLIWFLTGPYYVPAALGIAGDGARLLNLILPGRTPIWAQVIGWMLVGGWLTRFPHGIWATRAGLAAAIFAGTAVAVAVRARIRGVTREWITGAFIIAIAALIIIQGMTTPGIRNVITRNAGALSLLGFTYALIWAVVIRLPRIPLRTESFPEATLLLLYLGAILLVASATLFGLAADLPSFQQMIALSQYDGTVALGIPVLLLTVASRWSRATAELRRRVMIAFAIGVAMSMPAFLARAASPRPEPVNPLPVTVALVLSVALVAFWPSIRSALGGGAAGVALSYGVAVGLSQRIFVDVLQSLLFAFAAVLGVKPVATIAFQIRALADAAIWRPEDTRLFYAGVPIVAGLLGAVTGVILERRARQRAGRLS